MKPAHDRSDRRRPESGPIAVLGAGAVGCYFGGMLVRAGTDVIFIGRPPHVEAMNRNGLLIESTRFTERIPVFASTQIEAVRDAVLVLLCVKAPDTVTAARSLAPRLASGASVISLQNGVDNADSIRSVAEIDVIPAAVYLSAEMTAPGCVKHVGRGDLVIGDLPRRNPPDESRQLRLEQIASRFVRADVPCRVSDDIEAELWAKLVLNCAYNAISALSRARYGPISENAATRAVMRQVVEEVVAVGRASGIRMSETDLIDSVWKLGEAMPDALSSTAQDITRGKRTEIDSLNGFVARRGAELGIATPVNQTLHGLMHLLEESSFHASREGSGRVAGAAPLAGRSATIAPHPR